jgi:8-oxo-dGTP pyrophosphatase MutT (NUDIX family)
MVREAKEEAGVDVTPDDLHSVYHAPQSRRGRPRIRRLIL